MEKCNHHEWKIKYKKVKVLVNPGYFAGFKGAGSDLWPVYKGQKYGFVMKQFAVCKKCGKTRQLDD